MTRKLIFLFLVAIMLALLTATPVLAADASTPADAWSQFKDIADGWALITLGVLVFSVLGLGVLNSLLNKETVLRRLWDISRKRLIPGLLGYFVLCFAGTVDESLRSLATASFGVFTAVLVGDILANLKELGVPFPLPDTVTKFLTDSGESKSGG
jgi:hypothetical protein